MATAKNILKQWFSNRQKPTQEQFWNWIDSFWHKDEKIPMSAVENLEKSLQEVPTTQQFENHQNDSEAHKTLFEGKVDKEQGKGLSTNDFSNEYKQRIDDFQLPDLGVYTQNGGYGGTAQDLNEAITAIEMILSVDDTDFDTLQEIVAQVKKNKSLKELLTNKADKTHTHKYSDLEGLPALFSGSYNDLRDKPTNLATTQNVTDAVNGIKIGGRNYFKKSNRLYENRHLIVLSSGSDFQSLDGKLIVRTITAIDYAEFDLNVFLSEPINPNQKYTLSYDSFTGDDLTLELLNQENVVTSFIDLAHGGFWKRKTWKFSVNQSVTKLRIKNNSAGIHIYGIDKIALYDEWNNNVWTLAPEDIDISVVFFQSNFNTSQLFHNGKVAVSQGTSNIVVTIDSESGFSASYQKGGTGNITFQAGSGKTLVQVDGTNILNGAKGSTATITIVGNEILLRISNV